MIQEFSGKVQTVSGLIDPDTLGICHSHEHVLFDYWKMIKSYDVIFDDEKVAQYELELYRDAGGKSLVDASSIGIGTNPNALRRISEKTGVQIVLGCGWYRESVYEGLVFKETSDQLAERMINQINVGFTGTDVKAGIIGEIGTERGHITAAEERVFRAAARASLETGVSIITHTTHFGELALEQIDLLESEGITPNKIIISHLGDREDASMLLQIAKRGVYCSIDNIGYYGDGYPDDMVRLTNIKTLIANNHGSQIVLGTDIGSRSALKSYGGRGFAHLINNFIPAMKQANVSELDIYNLTVKNISQAITIRP